MTILEVKNLSKQYGNYKLNDVTFSLPRGTIMGVVGENGAGKTTLINLILNLAKKDAGEIKIFNKPIEQLELAQKEDIGVVLAGNNFPLALTPQQMNKILKNIYSQWDEGLYFDLLRRLGLPENKKIKNFSKGMKMKFSLITALSHRPKILILDEPTTGLDPVMRDEILDLFLDFVQDEGCSILISSHITTDLEKVADYITYIKNGQLIFSQPKDDLIYNFGILKCDEKQFAAIERQDIISYLKKDYVIEVLVTNKEAMSSKYLNVVMDDAGIEDIMKFYTKGEQMS